MPTRAFTRLCPSTPTRRPTASTRTRSTGWSCATTARGLQPLRGRGDLRVAAAPKKGGVIIEPSPDQGPCCAHGADWASVHSSRSTRDVSHPHPNLGVGGRGACPRRRRCWPAPPPVTTASASAAWVLLRARRARRSATRWWGTRPPSTERPRIERVHCTEFLAADGVRLGTGRYTIGVSETATPCYAFV